MAPYSVVLNDTVYYARLGLYDCENVGESSTWTVAGYMTDSCPRTSMSTQNGEASFDLSNRDTTIYESSDGLLFIQTREEDSKYDFYGLEEAEEWIQTLYIKNRQNAPDRMVGGVFEKERFYWILDRISLAQSIWLGMLPFSSLTRQMSGVISSAT